LLPTSALQVGLLRLQQGAVHPAVTAQLVECLLPWPPLLLLLLLGLLLIRGLLLLLQQLWMLRIRGRWAWAKLLLWLLLLQLEGRWS
jgi:hypothetical protein